MMATITQLTDTLNTTIDEANIDIEKLDECNECMANQIEENKHLISWNEGCISHAEFTLEEIEKGQKTAIKVIRVSGEIEETADDRIESSIRRSDEFDMYRADKDATINRQRASIHGYGIRVNELVDGINEQQATIDKLRDENGYLRNRLRAIRAMPADDQDIRIRLASALHDLTTHWMKVAIKHPDIGRDFLDKPFDELASIDKYAALRDADTILDILQAERGDLNG